MLAQTNLQLYRQLIELGWSDTDLARVRAGYKLAAELFGARLRPNEKPFVCHLVGVASALARWDERPSMVLAGLLHSAYFLGEFADGERGATPRRRRYVATVIGNEAEQLLVDYGRNKRYALDELTDRDAIALELADLFDELHDTGPAFSPEKHLIHWSRGATLTTTAKDRAIEELAERVLGSQPAAELREALAALRNVEAPACLVSTRLSSFRVARGPSSLSRGLLHREAVKFQSKLLRRKAA